MSTLRIGRPPHVSVWRRLTPLLEYALNLALPVLLLALLIAVGVLT